MTRFDQGPEPADDFEIYSELRRRQQFDRTAERIEREKTEAANDEKMTRLRNKLDRGEFAQADPVARWYYNLGPGENLATRYLDELGDKQMDPYDEYEAAREKAKEDLADAERRSVRDTLAGYRQPEEHPGTKYWTAGKKKIASWNGVLDWLDAHPTVNLGPE